MRSATHSTPLDNTLGSAEQVVRHRDRRRTLFAWALLILLIITSLLAVSLGPVRIDPLHLLRFELTQSEWLVINTIRLPRLFTGMLVGACLGVAGAALQGLFRNPLADPGIVGVSSGAALAAVSVIVLAERYLPGIPDLYRTLYLLPCAAIIGGIGATLLVQHLATGRLVNLILAGIAISAIAQAGTGLLTFMADDFQLRTLTFWTMGSLGASTWLKSGMLALIALPALVVIVAQARALNALLLGEDETRHLGFELSRIRRRLVYLSAIVVGAAVAVSGIIGFVGLVTPHLVRLIIGPDHRWLLPCAAVLGACLLLAADLIARLIVAPAELPIGIVTALIGGPFFLWLLLGSQRRSGRWE